jgi:hypothetical protein
MGERGPDYNPRTHPAKRFDWIRLPFVVCGPFLARGNCPSGETLFRFRKSMQSLISPDLLRVGTKFETHLENRNGTMILASYIFFISFSIRGSNLGLILLSFYLNGF